MTILGQLLPLLSTPEGGALQLGLAWVGTADSSTLSDLAAVPGAFSNTQMNVTFVSNVNGVDLKTEYQSTQGNAYTTDGVIGAVSIPASATVWQVNGITGYVVSRAVGGAGGPAAVGVYGQGRANSTVAGQRAWGANFVSAARNDNGSNTSVASTLYGVEVDVCPGNAGDGADGVLSLLNANLTNFTGNAAFLAGGNTIANGNRWSFGLQTMDGGAAVAVGAGAAVTSGTGNSQPVRFYYYNGGTQSYVNLYADSNGNLTSDGGKLITNNIQITASGSLNGLTIMDAAAGPVPGITLGTGNHGRGAAIAFLGCDAAQGVNWLIGNQYNNSGMLEITPSTAAGGSTFTTPIVLLDSSKLTLTKPLKLPVYTVATLPTASAALAGAMAAVSDATAPTYNGALTGGGTVYVPVFCDGTRWTSH